MRKSLPIALLALVLTTALGAALLLSPAVAATNAGRVQTTGKGKVVIQGQVVAFGLTAGASRIVVVDRRGDANLTMNGHTYLRSKSKKQRKKRRVVIKKAVGRFYVRGSRVSVVIQSAQLNVSIAGRGKLRMKGVGRFTLNGSKARDWSRNPRRWRTIKLKPPRRK